MSIKESIVSRFRKLYVNAGVPCNDLFIKSIMEHVGIDSEILERTDEMIIVKLLYDDAPMILKCTFRQSENVIKFINKVELVR